MNSLTINQIWNIQTCICMILYISVSNLSYGVPE